MATTSKIVEYLSNSLSHSYPLYSVDAIADGFLLVFCVEVDGFLTFDLGSEVRITLETSLFEKLYYNPAAFALVRAADAFKPYVTGAYVRRYDNPGGIPSEVSVTVHYSIAGQEDVLLNVDAATFDATKSIGDHFPNNSRWPGLQHLPKGFVDVGFASPNIP